LYCSGVMLSYHRQTCHSWQSVRRGRALDWRQQPWTGKRYAAVSGMTEIVPLDADVIAESLRDFLALCYGITARKHYPGGSHALRTVPSAGALYPCELYLQCRGAERLPDGIFHFDPVRAELRQLATLGADGLEGLLEDRRLLGGLLLVVTAVYGRSAWKYGDRAFRYCLLDAGHLCGAVEAACRVQGRPWRLLHRFDGLALRQALGCDMRELPLAVIQCGIPEEPTVAPPACPPPPMADYGVLADSLVIAETWRQCQVLGGCRAQEQAARWCFSSEQLRTAILRRRSIRVFHGETVSRMEHDVILRLAMDSVSSDCDEELAWYVVVHRVEGLTPGLYRNGVLLREGDLRRHTGYLCLEQALGADSAATLFLTGRSGNYRPLMLKAGVVGQRIYLAATALGLGCSGIGAFYDEELNDFLACDDMILYALAFGR